MRYRILGISGLRVSGLFLAAMTFGELLAGWSRTL
jgi:aryl-alcohol dehydrogenase-like predicted oxidoreductase